MIMAGAASGEGESERVGVAEQGQLEDILRKAAAERRAGRAKLAADEFHKAAEAKRAEEEQLEAMPQGSIDSQLARVQSRRTNTEAKEEDVDKEEDETKEFLAEDENRDLATTDQIDKMQEEQENMQGLMDVESELQLRLAKRNKVPGAVAVDKFGLEITKQPECEKEMNTIFRDEKCFVGHEEEGPDSPGEISAYGAAQDQKGEWEAAKEEFWKADRARLRAREKKGDVELLLKQSHNATKKADLERELAVTSKALKEKEKVWMRAKDSLEQKSVELEKAYSELRRTQQGVEKKDLDSVEAADKVRAQAKKQIATQEERAGDVEEEEAKVLDDKARRVGDEAEAAEGDEKDELEKEAAYYRKWSKDAHDEGASLRKHKMKDAIESNSQQESDLSQTKEAHRLALADAASMGRGQELLTSGGGDAKTEAKLAKDNGLIESSLQDSANAGEQFQEMTAMRIEAESHRNKVALREAQTEDNLKKIADERLLVAKAAKSGLSGASLLASGLIVRPLALPRRRSGRRARILAERAGWAGHTFL
ncbi:unnamed protein product [Prorocentrum cordatum]|uniref:Uncharacterized protein n=1 Tax=Prorocentrum cordatum TaxID=2364126 RepID=A0ABN9S2W2_9DINO|nr:unnamed protein product [Polarella glacialis]